MKKNILVLDDDLFILNTIRKAFTNQQYTVITYTYPKEALEYYLTSNIKYDLIITDIEMPGMDGYEFIDEIRKTDPDIKTIGMSGSVISECKPEKFNHFIEKPFDVESIRNAVSKILE